MVQVKVSIRTSLNRKEDDVSNILADLYCPRCGGDVEDIGADIAKCVDCGYSYDYDTVYSDHGVDE